MNCKNCDTEVTMNYCPNCGQASKLERINGHYIMHEIVHVLHFEKGILYTIRELIIRPGENVKYFLSENRSRLVKPIAFIILTSLIYTLVNHFFHIEDGYVKYEDIKQPTTGLIFGWVQDHYGYANIIMGVFIAFWTKLFFKKYGYNFYEILILLCFVMGMGMLLFSVFGILQTITHLNLMQAAGFIGIAYCTWAIGQFFNKKKPANYFKAFAAYMIGMLTFIILAIVSGAVIDLVINH